MRMSVLPLRAGSVPKAGEAHDSRNTLRDPRLGATEAQPHCATDGTSRPSECQGHYAHLFMSTPLCSSLPADRDQRKDVHCHVCVNCSRLLRQTAVDHEEADTVAGLSPLMPIEFPAQLANEMHAAFTEFLMPDNMIDFADVTVRARHSVWSGSPSLSAADDNKQVAT